MYFRFTAFCRIWNLLSKLLIIKTLDKNNTIFYFYKSLKSNNVRPAKLQLNTRNNYRKISLGCPAEGFFLRKNFADFYKLPIPIKVKKLQNAPVFE